MDGCTACGRIALGESHSPVDAKIFCPICGNTGVPDAFKNFPAGLSAPAPLADDSYWRNEVARSALRASKKQAERETSEAFALLAVIKSRLIAFRQRVFDAVAERAAP